MNKLVLRIPFILFFVCATIVAYAQKANWQNLDLKTDTAFGISTERAYHELLKGKKPVPVLVAVIDDGVDTAHEDLKAIIWNNPESRKHDQYPNDLHGWNFLGSAKGNVNNENIELTRLVRQGNSQFSGKDSAAISPKDRPAFLRWQAQKKSLEAKIEEVTANAEGFKPFKRVLDTVMKRIGKANPDYADFESYQPRNKREERVKTAILENKNNYPNIDAFIKAELTGPLDYYQNQLDYSLNLDYDPRSIVGDDYLNSSQRNYGNNDVTGPDAHHGTHVAGIIAAVRNNNIGINGVADDVQIMSVRAVPNGDERDKDVANAIRYAVDNGAKIINMSFGKEYSFDKKAVDEAVKYAAKKDVLLIHAAGNDNKNLDSIANYPNRNYEKGGSAPNWIEVGASGWKDDETLKADFSNYGKTTVDVFAPGVQINSTVPGSKYDKYDGTSMATPVVVGLAALIREYYPKLTALQVKDLIMQSVIKINHPVKVKTGKETRLIPFADLCTTGGIINAYRALQLAAKRSAI